MQEIEKNAQNVKSREDFIIFLDYLIRDFKENLNNWKNRDIPSYFEAMQSWIEDMDGFYQNNNISISKNIDWKIFSDILMAARIYE